MADAPPPPPPPPLPSLGDIFEQYENLLTAYQTLLEEDIAAARTNLQINVAAIPPDADLLIDELVQGYLRLPVVGKAMELGPLNGMYYTNRLGKKVYLKRYQKIQCAQDQLKGSGNFCSTNHDLFAAAVIGNEDDNDDNDI